MKFAKAHGTGNDFVVVPDPDGALDLTADQVALLCDRRRGIGADGLLRVVRSAKHPDAVGMAGAAEWFMDYRNQDGSIAEMCGNGVRAFARYLTDSGLAGPSGPGHVATRAGVVAVEVRPDTITVDMPRPEIVGTGTATIAGRSYPGVKVAVGNPNLVIDLPDLDALAALDLAVAPALVPDEFPAGANVEFVVHGAPADGADAAVTMRVSERGIGETLSCGSGACAVAAAVLRAAGRDSGTVVVDVPGGRLTLRLDPTSCRLTGPAVIVATGDTTLA